MSGIDLQYTSHYLVENADVIAKVATLHSDPGIGISLGNNLTDVTVVNATTSGFETGLYAAKTSTFHAPGGTLGKLKVPPLPIVVVVQTPRSLM